MWQKLCKSIGPRVCAAHVCAQVVSVVLPQLLSWSSLLSVHSPEVSVMDLSGHFEEDMLRGPGRD